MSDVVVLGAGLMGSAVARCLAASSLDVGVWNRTPERAAPLAADGITVHDLLDEALSSAPVVVSLLASSDALADVLAASPDSWSGRTLVNLTTGTPDEVVRARGWADAHGTAYVGGMVSGRPQDAGTDAMHVTVAGADEVWTAQRDLLERLTPHVQHTGEDVAVPSVLGLACTGVFFLSTLGAFVEAAAFAAGHGIAPERVAAEIPRYLRRVATEVEGFTALMTAGSYETSHASAEVYAGALEAAADAMAAVGQPAHITRAAVANLQLVRDADRGDESPAAVLDVLT